MNYADRKPNFHLSSYSTFRRSDNGISSADHNTDDWEEVMLIC